MFLHFTGRNSEKKKKLKSQNWECIKPVTQECVMYAYSELCCHPEGSGKAGEMGGTSWNSTQRDAKLCSWGGTTPCTSAGPVATAAGAWEWVLYQGMDYRGPFILSHSGILCQSNTSEITMSVFSLQNSQWLSSSGQAFCTSWWPLGTVILSNSQSKTLYWC